MKAVVCPRYGPPEVLEIREVPDPEPGPGDVLVRVRAAAVTAGDSRLRACRMPPGFGPLVRLAMGLHGPRQPVLGGDFAGDVAAVGRDVARFRPGEAVFGTTGVRLGAHAELLAVPAAAAIAPKPAGLTYEEAASIPFGGLSALYFLRDLGGLRRGHRVLVLGASGAVGTAAVQLARHAGAEVTGTCGPRNAELVASLGAARVIDYTREPLPFRDGPFDLVFDTVGAASFLRDKGLLARDGRWLAAVAGLADFPRALWTSVAGGPALKVGMAPEVPADLRLLKERVEAGQYRAVVDKAYPMAQAAEAHRHVDGGHKRGNVVLTMP